MTTIFCFGGGKMTVKSPRVDASLHQQKWPKRERVHTGAIKTAHRATRVGDERLPKQIEGSVDQDRCWRGLAEFVQQLPVEWIVVFLHGVHFGEASKYSAARSAGTDSAKGWKPSRCLMN